MKKSDELMKKFNVAERLAAACGNTGDAEGMKRWEGEALKLIKEAEKAKRKETDGTE